MGHTSAHRSPNSSVSKLPYHPNYYAASAAAAANRLQWESKRHKTPSSDDGDESGESSAAAVGLSRVDRYQLENFRSLYRRHDVVADGKDDDGADGVVGDDICRAFYINEPVDFSPRFTVPPPEVIRASKRFFAAPGLASSLVEEARLSASSCSMSRRSSDVTVSASSCGDSTAVITVSRNPYDDFRRSMVEMVMAHHADVGDSHEMLDWDFMEDLLLSYLNLNDKSVHKDVLRAFVDVTAGIGCSPGAN